MKYYAVAKGVKVGIFTSWSETQGLVNKFPGAVFKSFGRKEDAIQFLSDNGCDAPVEVVCEPNKRQKIMPAQKEPIAVSAQVCEKPKGPIEIYCDGACKSNGTKEAVAGIGIYWGPENKRNVSRRFDLDNPTNQRAELLAAAVAVESIDDSEEYVIVTDSKYTINCASVWHFKWAKMNWMSSKNKPVLNKDLITRLLAACKGKKVSWKHVRGHKGVAGNEHADTLANAGCNTKNV